MEVVDNFWQEYSAPSDEIPIVMIDRSGSTDIPLFNKKINEVLIINLTYTDDKNIEIEIKSDDGYDSDDSNAHEIKKNILEKYKEQIKEKREQKEKILVSHKKVSYNILKYEIEIVKKYFQSKGVEKIYLMFWNDCAKFILKILFLYRILIK